MFSSRFTTSSIGMPSTKAAIALCVAAAAANELHLVDNTVFCIDQDRTGTDTVWSIRILHMFSRSVFLEIRRSEEQRLVPALL